jgi:hypothetical protein
VVGEEGGREGKRKGEKERERYIAMTFSISLNSKIPFSEANSP